jgi:hypothetical protein
MPCTKTGHTTSSYNQANVKKKEDDVDISLLRQRAREKRQRRMNESDIQHDIRSNTARDHIRDSRRLRVGMQQMHSKINDERTDPLDLITEDVKLDVLSRLQFALGPDGLNKVVCTVCDRLVLYQESMVVLESDLSFLSDMQRCLKPCDNIPSI